VFCLKRLFCEIVLKRVGIMNARTDGFSTSAKELITRKA